MKPVLIIIRGNSGSGKTTVANLLRDSLPKEETLLISQDVIRRNMLGVKDRKNNLAIGLIQQTVEYGHEHCRYIILEGILGREIYQEMFEELYVLFEDNVLAYYFDISFEETLRRHQKRPQALDFNEIEMKKWWLEKDYLKVSSESSFTNVQSKNEILQLILTDLSHLTQR